MKTPEQKPRWKQDAKEIGEMLKEGMIDPLRESVKKGVVSAGHHTADMTHRAASGTLRSAINILETAEKKLSGDRNLHPKTEPESPTRLVATNADSATSLKPEKKLIGLLNEWKEGIAAVAIIFGIAAYDGLTPEKKNPEQASTQKEVVQPVTPVVSSAPVVATPAPVAPPPAAVEVPAKTKEEKPKAKEKAPAPKKEEPAQQKKVAPSGDIPHLPAPVPDQSKSKADETRKLIEGIKIPSAELGDDFKAVQPKSDTTQTDPDEESLEKISAAIANIERKLEKLDTQEPLTIHPALKNDLPPLSKAPARTVQEDGITETDLIIPTKKISDRHKVAAEPAIARQKKYPAMLAKIEQHPKFEEVRQAAETAEKVTGVPWPLLVYIAASETKGFDSMAVNPTSGASGQHQIKPDVLMYVLYEKLGNPLKLVQPTKPPHNTTDKYEIAGDTKEKKEKNRKLLAALSIKPTVTAVVAAENVKVNAKPVLNDLVSGKIYKSRSVAPAYAHGVLVHVFGGRTSTLLKLDADPVLRNIPLNQITDNQFLQHHSEKELKEFKELLNMMANNPNYARHLVEVRKDGKTFRTRGNMRSATEILDFTASEIAPNEPLPQKFMNDLLGKKNKIVLSEQINQAGTLQPS